MTNETRPIGVVVTIKDIHENVNRLLSEMSNIKTLSNDVVQLQREHDALEERTRKLEIQNAAHWIVHTLALSGIAAAVGRIFA